ASRRRSCAPAPSRPTRPRISYENRLSSLLDIATFHSLYLRNVAYVRRRTMTATGVVGTKADRWGRLWGSRADDWALTEEQQLPTYAGALDRLALADGDRVLEVGCGSGVFLRAAVDRGAAVTGLDSSEPLGELAPARAPAAAGAARE